MDLVTRKLAFRELFTCKIEQDIQWTYGKDSAFATIMLILVAAN